MICWNMVVSGACAFLSSNACSLIGKYISTFAILVGTMVVHVALFVLLLQWNYIESHDIYPYLLISGIYGACDTIWRSQLVVILGSLFPERKNEAFSLFEFWMSIGYIISFGYGNHLCVSVKIYINIAVIVVGVGLCGIVQYWRAKSEPQYEKLTTNDNSDIN